MEDVYGSVMSFRRVPCTPVSGAYASFYDVFGDIERTGTGSSDELPVERNVMTEGRPNRKHSGFSTTSSIQSDPYIAFLQQKQDEILGALHQEIRVLKHENSELKFQIHVILQQRQLDDTRPCSLQTKVSTNAPDESYDKFNENASRNRERTLELELESATKMIEELKWVQQHYEKRIRVQELRIDDLERQVSFNSGASVKVVPMGEKSPVFQSNRIANSTSHYIKPNNRQRGSAEQRPPTHRRKSLQSILPDDYKEQVATLPPIQSSSPFGAPAASLRSAMSTAPPLLNKQNEQAAATAKSKKSSSLMQSTPSLLRNNTPAFIGDNSGQHNGEAQFYFSK